MFDMEYIKDIFKQNYIAIFAILFGIMSLVLSAVYVHYNLANVETGSNLCEDNKSTDEIPNADEIVQKIKVDVKGAVKKPGVYELGKDANIQDAILMAGGMTSKGSTSNINLSKRLSDEMVIYVFTKDELKKKEAANEVVCEIPKCECETFEVVECPNVNGNDENKGNSSSSDSKKVSINKGTIDELMTLDGVGESKAQAIIEYREKNGSFLKLEDLMNVSGIGEKAFEKIKDKIVL